MPQQQTRISLLCRWPRLLVLLALWSVGTLCAAAPASETATGAAGQPLTVTDQVTLGPAPTSDQAATLVAQNGLFIDLRTDEDLQARMATSRAGLHRSRLPIDDLKAAAANVATLRDMLAGAGERPVWIGCNSGNRAALTWALLQRAQGQSPEAALAQVEALVTYEPIRTAIHAR